MPTYIFRYRLMPPEPPTLAVPVTAPTLEAARPEADAKALQLARGRTLGPCLDVEEWADLPPFS
jgi:hypothetical protein